MMIELQFEPTYSDWHHKNLNKKKPQLFLIRAFFHKFWLPDLDSNQGPAD